MNAFILVLSIIFADGIHASFESEKINDKHACETYAYLIKIQVHEEHPDAIVNAVCIEVHEDI